LSRAPTARARTSRSGAVQLPDELVGRQRAAAKAADREHGPVQGERRDDHIHPRAVGQARVAERLGLVDAPPERGEDALDRVAQLGLGGEGDVGRLQAPRPLDPHGPRAVDHHLLDRRVAQERLERPEPEGALGDQRDEMRAGRLVEQAGLAVDGVAYAAVQIGVGAGRRLGQQAGAQVVGQPVEHGGLGVLVHGQRPSV
jgi:hypothetical protein